MLNWEITYSLPSEEWILVDSRRNTPPREYFVRLYCTSNAVGLLPKTLRVCELRPSNAQVKEILGIHSRIENGIECVVESRFSDEE